MMTDNKRQALTNRPFRILSLDGGGAKGFYTLGVLKEIESLTGKKLHQTFDLVFGTSTGSIIASLIALGYEVDYILALYREHVPKVMKHNSRSGRTASLSKLAEEVFGDATFHDVQTGLGVVASRWIQERPMIFKSDPKQAHGRQASFVPGFGVPIRDAIRASCSAFPFFEPTTVQTSLGEKIQLIDGGFCANNPTLYAIADAVKSLNKSKSDIRVVSVGVGFYPKPKGSIVERLISRLVSVRLLQKTLEINTQSMDQLRSILFDDIETVRISDSFTEPHMATDLLEHNLDKLDILFQRGRDSFSQREKTLRSYLTES
ncbi:patatin-like phospholipase family protein [Pseudomonas syringae]|uniref:patatin-like phospholipase family protein n=1 Tax=Pseudomonas syringae TaxID=317 RepID=UPI001CB942BF|nr:patatin-like phospholipase family protein [Pseudomonas syringae]MCK9707712.1 patatin-like phospholipase family protein [Pseudomonas syringae pv. syringae]MCK9778623.1 patatin-like phospholipase family protein [Pseudomonas syringae pv. syringae]